MSNYETLAAINVNDKVEKKQKFSYLSWAWAVDTLMRADPTANWEYKPSMVFPDGTMMVFCTVTAFGVARTMQLPVINHSNKPIANPNAFDINTSMQRCLVKAIALHGLGLYLYAGEDLPPDGEPEPEKKEKPKSVARQQWDLLSPEEQKYLADCAIPMQDELDKGNIAGAYERYEQITYDNEIQQAAFWSLISAPNRASLKNHKESLKTP